MMPTKGLNGRFGGCPDFGSGESAFDVFLELIPDALVVIDSAGVIVSVNVQAEKLFGYPRAELIGAAIEVVVPARYAEAHREHRGGYFADPRTRPMGIGLVLSGRRKDGSEFPADISLSAIETPSGRLAAAAIRDLTERIEAERQRSALEAESRTQQARRLESIGELAGGISHDFNNLLAVILINTELALETVGQHSAITDELEEAITAAEHAAKLTRQLLVFSRHQVTPSETLDLNSVVGGMEQLLRRSIGEQIDLEVRLAEDLPPILADPSQMEQVVLNLAINARDAMSSGGRLGIATQVVDLDDEYAASRPDVTPGCYVRLAVADDGAGMPNEVVARAFEPFFTTKPKGQGTGLGLATVYGIVKRCEGHVSIYSEEANGTVVRVHLPIASAEAFAVQIDSVAAPTFGRGQTILVVEDSDSVRRGACKVLRKHGYKVVEAERGAEALDLVEDGGIDLVISDMVMPEMLGTELAELLQETNPDLSILFMSGYADIAGPIDDSSKLIEKPFTSARLLTAVSEALARTGGQAD